MSPASWEREKQWADRYLPAIQDVVEDNVGKIVQIVVEASSPEDDRTRGVDYRVRAESGDIACRIRRLTSTQSLRDLTLRYRVPSGAKTEVAKIAEGFGRWYLYAWAYPDQIAFEDWMIVDLDILRRHWDVVASRLPIPNKDGSAFLAVSFESLCRIGAVVNATMVPKAVSA